MHELAFESFKITLPDGWSDVLEEATYSDPDQLPPMAFAREDGAGVLTVWAPVLDPEDVPEADPGDMEDLALDWGVRRGLDAPLYCVASTRRDAAVATAAYRVGDDFVALWFLCDGGAMLYASYVCPWAERDAEKGEREAIAASLRIA